jgi:hypothetical protein
MRPSAGTYERLTLFVIFSRKVLKKEVHILPQLRFHAIREETVKAASKPMTEELASVVGCAREHFVLECVPSSYVWDGDTTQGYPYVEVYCFDRGEEAFDKMAKAITRHLLAAGCESVDVAFMLLDRRRYYEDGQHL